MSSCSSNDRGGVAQKNNEHMTPEETSEQQKSDDLRNNDDAVVPTSNDVLLGRGRANVNHPGNVQFREIVGRNFGAYLRAQKKAHKSMIVKTIVNEAFAQGARFLKQEGNSESWTKVGVKTVRDKVGHALRDATQGKSKSVEKLHLDLMQQRKKMPKAEPTRRQISTNLSVVRRAGRTLTSLCDTPDIVTGKKYEWIDRDSKYHVGESHSEIDDESSSSTSESEVYDLLANISSRADSLSPQPRITGSTSTKEIIAEGVYTEDQRMYEEIQNIFFQSRTASSSCSAEDAFVDIVNDMTNDELDDCLESDSKSPKAA